MVDWKKLLELGEDTITWKFKQLPDLRWMNISYCQEGEDLILHALGVPKKGFYVDVGAYLPKRMSNTYRLFLIGWSGVNIDLSEDSINKFKKARPVDINLVHAVSDKVEQVEVKLCGDGAFNSIVPDFEKENSGRVAVRKFVTKTETLKNIFEKHGVKKIDYLNVDCEGADLRVLKGNDWSKFIPTIISVEILGSINEALDSGIHKFLVSKGYIFVAKTPLTAFYKRS